MLSRGDEGMGDDRRGRIVLVAVTVALAVLTAVLMYDSFHMTKAGLQVVPIRAHRLVDVAASIGRERGVNPIIAVASREAGGERVVLELPVGYSALLARKPDSFTGRVTATLDKGLLDPFIGGRVREAEYDPILDAATAASLESGRDTIRLPMDVWALPAKAGVTRARLYTDPARLRIYVVPLGTFGGDVQ